MTAGSFVLVLIFMMAAGMNSKATFQSVIASWLVIGYPRVFVNTTGVTGYGWALLVFWLASILITFMRSA
jgi:hypothetical protein